MASDRGVCECCQSEESRRVLKRLTREYATADGREVYRDMLMECFDIVVPSRAADGLICAACVTRLRDAASFKRLVLRSQRSLTETRKTAGTTSNAIKSETDGTLPEHVAFEAMDTDSRGFSDGDLIDKVKKEEPSSEDDAPLMRSLWHGREGSKAREVRRGPPVATVSAARSKMSTRETIDKLPNVLRETMRRLLSTTATSVRRKTTKAMDKTNGTATIKIPVKGSKMASTKCLKISLKPDYLLKSTQSKLAPTDLLKLTQSKMAKPTKKIESVPRVSECHASFYNAIMLLKSSNATPFREEVKKEEPADVVVDVGALLIVRPHRPEVLVDGKKQSIGKRTGKFAKKKRRVKVGLSESEAHAHNTGVLLACCNAMPFRGKNTRGYRCFYCDHCSKDPELLRRHTQDRHRDEKLSRTVPKFEAAECVLYLDVASLSCELCAQDMSDLDELRTHLTKIHKKTLHPSFRDRHIPFVLHTDRTLDCQKCSQKFESFGALERHMNMHYRNFVCEVCGSGYVTMKRLKTHAAFAHSSGSFPCASCEKIFTSAIKAKKHADSVHKLKNRYKCPHCHEKFFKYFQRQTHLVKEHNATPLEYRCTLCNRIFEMKDSLNKHTRKHHLLERNYACAECSYTCFTSTGLRNHMVSHTGERTYQCSVCSKSYARKNTLTQHMKIHNNDRRYACNACGLAFVQNCSLKSHVRTHHPEEAVKELLI